MSLGSLSTLRQWRLPWKGWKHFLIPHEHNNYWPHLIHHRRLLFHGLSAIAVKLILVLTITVLPVSAWMTPDVLSDQAREIIRQTNELRAGLGLNPLTENPLLAAAAAAKTKDMFLAQYFAHVNPSGKGLAGWLTDAGYLYQIAGENLAMGFNTPAEVMTGWTNSPSHYANLTKPTYTEIGVSAQSDGWKGLDTTLVAQLFGLQKTAATKQPAPETLGQSVNAPDTAPAPTEPIIVKAKDSSVTLVQQPQSKETLVQITTVLNQPAIEAMVDVGADTIPLQPQTADNTVWSGQAALTADTAEHLQQPLVPASLTVVDTQGNVSLTGLEWNNVTPVEPSLISQYSFLRHTQPNGLRKIFQIVQTYYQILLGLAVVGLLLTVLIEIRRQRPKAIISALSFIGLLLVLSII